MKRLSAGLPAFALVATLAPSAPAAAAEPNQDVDPVDHAARLTAGQVPREAIERFMAADRETQARLLEAAGFTDPGGDIDLEAWRLSLVGQWLTSQGDTVRGAELQVRSGSLGAAEALALTEAIAPRLTASEAEISDTMLATGMSYDEAAGRARLQRLASLVRPAISEVDAGYLSLTISDEVNSLVYRTTQPDQGSRALGELTTSVSVERSTYSRQQLEAERERVLEALRTAGVADGTYVSIDTSAQQVVVEAPAEGPALRAAEPDGALADAVSSGLVRLEPLGGATGDDVAYRGGVDATGCTWGFSLGNPNVPNWKGLSVSGHCGTSQSFFGTSLTYLIEQWEGEADIQLHSVPPNEIITNDVWINSGGTSFYRDITATTGWTSLDANDVVCMRGSATAYHCGYITDVASQQAGQSDAGGSASHAVRTTLTSAEGDSGAPIIHGQTAIGNNDGRINGVETFISLTYNYANLSAQVRTK